MDRVAIKWMKMRRKMVLIAALNIHGIQVNFMFYMSINNLHCFDFLQCRSEAVSALEVYQSLCAVAEPLLSKGVKFFNT